MRPSALLPLLVLALPLPLAAQAGGHAGHGATAVALGATSPPQHLTAIAWDAATRTARLQLVGGAPAAKSPFNFNGFTDGEANVVVPEGATVVMEFINEDGVPHSAAIIADTDPMPNMFETAAIPRAYTIKAVEGMNQGEKDTMRFTAAPGGTYRIFCGVPGHGLSGMWIRFTVSATATEPRFEVTGS